MLVAMLAERRWLFAMMVVPGIIGCAASAALSSVRTDAVAEDDAKTPSHISPDVHDDGCVFPERCPSWESLALPFAHEEPALWRHIVRVWLQGGESRHHALRATVGVRTDGPFEIDLVGQGPHALVAGTTGSGKSVLLQTWCIALACRYPADRLNFVFLDFKGGSAFNGLARLPHVVGNVCDLDLSHAVRALESIEGELRRRERLVAERRVGDVRQLRDPPPRLLIVVDEFHALRSQLPDSVDRLVRIASLGRSLGMHLVACTQHPSGQVSADMKANIAIGICLRVRDAMQSRELVGSDAAASISPSLPGAAYCHDGERLAPFLCAQVSDMDSIVRAIGVAHRFRGTAMPRRLFSAPLPRSVYVSAEDTPCVVVSESGHRLVGFGLSDDGVTLGTARIRIADGNVAIIGQHGRGKSTLIRLLLEALRNEPHMQLVFSRAEHGGMIRKIVHRTQSETPTILEPFASHKTTSGTRQDVDGPPACPHTVWLADDADPLFDPIGSHPLRDEFHRALLSPDMTVVFAVGTSRHVRVPEHCATRIVFPTADRPTDLMNGIPPEVLGRFTPEDFDTAGRAVLLERGRASPVQCFLLRSVGESS
ncbi:cell division protein FtsK [Bifidobacterium sp. SO1]|nr:cell division protein FtsK [Bifidobacterium sp. SO1]MBW3078309.1 cell division protein FtsK [Bifidobacterium simiiventris]